MKKIAILVTIVTMCCISIYGQSDSVNNVVESTHNTVTVGGSVEYSSKNVSLGTGLVFSEEPAVIFNGAVTVELAKKFGVSAFYTGYCGTQRLEGNQFHIVDLLASYNVNNELTLYTGPEFTYSDNGTNDETGAGLILMATYNKSKLNSTGILYSDPCFRSIYVISSVNYQVKNNFSIDALVGVTNAETKPIYGLAGIKYNGHHIFAGAHYIFRSDAPGPVFNIGLTF